MTLIKDTLKQNKRLYRISKIIRDLSEEMQVPAFLVGGCVRAVSYTHLTLPTKA